MLSGQEVETGIQVSASNAEQQAEDDTSNELKINLPASTDCTTNRRVDVLLPQEVHPHLDNLSSSIGYMSNCVQVSVSNSEQEAEDISSNDLKMNKPASTDFSISRRVQLAKDVHPHIGNQSSSMDSKAKFMSLYSHPRQRQRWGDFQSHPMKDWGDIFFDLFYVAAAYNLGNLLKDDPTLQGMLYLAGCFLPIATLWTQKLVYDSRFYLGDDIFHRFYEVLIFLAIASAILHIVPVSELAHPEASKAMFSFSLSITVADFLEMGRFVEVGVCQRRGCTGLHPEAFFVSIYHLAVHVLAFLLYLAATVYSAIQFYNYNSTPTATPINSTNSDDHIGEEKYRWLADSGATSSYDSSSKPNDVAVWLLIAGVILVHACLLLYHTVLYFSKRIDFKTVSVPMNIDYCIHRYGEFAILMMGESVLSLLIVTFIPSKGYAQVFYCGIISIALLQYLHFRSQPHHADEHAMRRSRFAGVMFVMTMLIYSMALIVLGASFKMFLYEQVYQYQEKQGRRLDMLATASTTPFILNTNPGWRGLADSTDGSSNSTTTSTTSYTSSSQKDDQATNIAMFYCISLAIVWFCMDFMLLLHRGIQKHQDDIHQCNRVRCAIAAFVVICRLALIFFMGTFWLTEVQPTVLALVGLWCMVLQLITRELGECLFRGGGGKANEEDESEAIKEKTYTHANNSLSQH